MFRNRYWTWTHAYNQTRIRIRAAGCSVTADRKRAVSHKELQAFHLFFFLFSFLSQSRLQTGRILSSLQGSVAFFLFSLWTGSSWTGLKAAARAEKGLDESEVADGVIWWRLGRLPSSFFNPLSPHSLFPPPPPLPPPSSTRVPAQAITLIGKVFDQTKLSPLSSVAHVPLYKDCIPFSVYSCFAQSRGPLYFLSPTELCWTCTVEKSHSTLSTNEIPGVPVVWPPTQVSLGVGRAHNFLTLDDPSRPSRLVNG